VPKSSRWREGRRHLSQRKREKGKQKKGCPTAVARKKSLFTAQRSGEKHRCILAGEKRRQALGDHEREIQPSGGCDKLYNKYRGARVFIQGKKKSPIAERQAGSRAEKRGDLLI